MTDVAFTLEVLIEDYCQDNNGRKPAGIILGPAEYRQLCERMRRSSDFLKQTAVEDILLTEYKGFPVHVKELPGIDLAISYQEAFHAYYR